MSAKAYQKQFTANPAELGNVAVLFGGTSAEREISLQSGQAVFEAFKAQGFPVVAIDIGEKPVAQLLEQNIQLAVIVLHGCGGEDGKIQALLELLNIPYTGSGVAASSLAMNKLKTKQVWLSVGLPTPEFEILRDGCDYQSTLSRLGGECFVKPIHEGSSLGMSCAVNAVELAQAHSAAKKFDSVVIAERRIKGREFTVAILNGQSLPSIEMRTDNRFYDYQAKYFSDDTQYFCPSDLTQDKEDEIQSLALQAFNAVDGEGWGRVDFMQDQQGKFYLLEVNTVPGMTSHSLVPMAAKAAGLSFAELVNEILVSAL
ncbi:D-alanine--D-alanine ligase [Thalassocella blandensis]|nr:D-alanine--D-alanine ligase [Thalassocella blandensis]